MDTDGKLDFSDKTEQFGDLLDRYAECVEDLERATTEEAKFAAIFNGMVLTNTITALFSGALQIVEKLAESQGITSIEQLKTFMDKSLEKIESV